MFAADSGGLSGSVCTQLFSKAKERPSRPRGIKTEFNMKWQFKVIQGHEFWDQWKADGDTV